MIGSVSFLFLWCYDIHGLYEKLCTLAAIILFPSPLSYGFYYVLGAKLI